MKPLMSAKSLYLFTIKIQRHRNFTKISTKIPTEISTGYLTFIKLF
jgi:hypothetical protein